MRPRKSISYHELRDLVPEQFLDQLAVKTKVEGWLVAKMRFVRELELSVIETFFEVLAPLYGYSKSISVPDNTS